MVPLALHRYPIFVKIKILLERAQAMCYNVPTLYGICQMYIGKNKLCGKPSKNLRGGHFCKKKKKIKLTLHNTES
jgi:hypothetical protein